MRKLRVVLTMCFATLVVGYCFVQFAYFGLQTHGAAFGGGSEGGVIVEGRLLWPLGFEKKVTIFMFGSSVNSPYVEEFVTRDYLFFTTHVHNKT